MNCNCREETNCCNRLFSRVPLTGGFYCESCAETGVLSICNTRVVAEGGGSIIGPIKVEQVICKWNQSSLEVSVPRHLMSLNLNVRVRVRVSGLNSLFYIVSFYCLLACTLISLWLVSIYFGWYQLRCPLCQLKTDHHSTWLNLPQRARTVNKESVPKAVTWHNKYNISLYLELKQVHIMS